jgi:TolA-binding protein
MVGHTLHISLLVLLFVVQAAGQPMTSSYEAQDYTVAYGLYKDGQYQLAGEEFLRFLDRHPASPRSQDAAYLIAECLKLSGRSDEALERYEQFRHDYPGSVLVDDALFRTAEIQYAAGRFPDAIKRFREVSSRRRNELAGEAAYWIGESYYKLDQLDSALAYYTKSRNDFPRGKVADFAWYSTGWLLQQRRMSVEAIDAYSQLITRHPNSPLAASARVRIGETHLQTGNLARASEVLTAARPALSDSNDRAEATYLLGEVAYRREDYPAALSWYDTSLTQYPFHRLSRDVMYSRAWVHLHQGKSEIAATEFLALAAGSDEVARTSQFRAGLALKLARKRRDAENQFVMVAGSAGHPFAPDALLELGVMRLEDRQPDSAATTLLKVIGRYPENRVRPRALYVLGEVLRSQGKTAESLAAYREAQEAKGATEEVAADALYQEGVTLARTGEHAGAVATLGSFLAKHPNDNRCGDAWFWLGEAQYHQEKFVEADSAYTLAIGKLSGPHAADALYGKAWTRYKLGDASGALRLFTRVAIEYPAGSYVMDACVRQGDCQYVLKDFKKAAATYREVLKKFPGKEGLDYARYQLGQALIRGGDTAAGVEELQALEKYFPKSGYRDDARFAIGWVSFQGRDYRKALKVFAEMPAAFPESDLLPRALCSAGDAHYNLGEYAEAVKIYRVVLTGHSSSPAVPDAIRGLRDAYEQMGKPAEGEAAVAQFLKEHAATPSAERITFSQAGDLFEQGAFADALNRFQSFSSSYPASAFLPQAQLYAAKCAHALGRLPDAESTLRSLLTKHPASDAAPGALLELGLLCGERKNYSEAVTLLQQAVREYPGTDEARQASVEQGRMMRRAGDEKRALEHLAKVTSTEKESRWGDLARVESADIYLEGREYSRATALYVDVARRRTDDLGAEAQHGAGETLVRQQRFKDAVALFARIKYLFPASTEWIARATLKMGDCYRTLKDAAAARELYKTVARQHADNAFGREAARKLTELQ